MRARSALFTLFGDVVRPAGGEAWLATLTACMDALDFSPEATRTALHRMTAEGWVAPRRDGRHAAYRLTARGVDRLEEAAERIYRLRAGPWDGRWRLLACPPARREASVVRELRWIGFGRLPDELWVSPRDHEAHVRGLLAEAGLEESAHRFTAEPRSEEEDARIVANAWDLSELSQAHRAFLARWRGVRTPVDPRRAFRTRIELVHHWRSFLFLDPGLPTVLLPAGWLGGQAAEAFAARYAELAEVSWRFYAELVAAAPRPPATVVVPSPVPPPFAALVSQPPGA